MNLRSVGVGLNNVGMLVRVWGRVVGGDGVSYFVINDGANLPVRVDVSGRRAAFEWAPAAGYVMLNGIVSLRQEEKLVPIIIPCLFPEMACCAF